MKQKNLKKVLTARNVQFYAKKESEDMDTKDMTLREVCQTLEVSRRAIQGYEKAGLVSATSKNKYGHLLYNKTARDRVAKIKLYQRFGFTIKEIQGIVDAPELVVQQVLREKIGHMEYERRQMDELIQKAQELLQGYQ